MGIVRGMLGPSYVYRLFSLSTFVLFHWCSRKTEQGVGAIRARLTPYSFHFVSFVFLQSHDHELEDAVVEVY